MSTPRSAASGDQRGVFAAEVAEYLQRTPRQLPSKYFYDALGSALFEAICRLPWYQVTRAESALLASHGAALLGEDAAPLTIAELGCGSGDKLATLIECGRRRIDTVQLIDVSAAALAMATARLDHLPIGRIITHQHTYADGLLHASANRGDSPMLVLFLGSNIGNFDPPADAQLLRLIRDSLRSGDALLLGTDLVKPEPELLLAYDDPLQVTAAFNRNLLRRINDELGGTFALDAFAHRAVWNAAESRVEMHLVSLEGQTARVDACDLEIPFAAGDTIWTESSYKYTPDQVVAMGRSAGFAAVRQYGDEQAGFAVTRFAACG
jgi:dimethylhistidine N-methyltransferase